MQGTSAHSAFRRHWRLWIAALLMLALTVWWVNRRLTDPRRSAMQMNSSKLSFLIFFTK
jgi:hypothetical protein